MGLRRLYRDSEQRCIRCLAPQAYICFSCSHRNYKLKQLLVLQRNLPRHYPYDNVYSLFPLTTPIKGEALFHDLQPGGMLPEGAIDFGRPKQPVITAVQTKAAISHVFNKSDTYITIYGQVLKSLSDGYGYVPCTHWIDHFTNSTRYFLGFDGIDEPLFVILINYEIDIYYSSF